MTATAHASGEALVPPQAAGYRAMIDGFELWCSRSRVPPCRHETASVYYDRTCNLGELAPCHRLGEVTLHGQSAASSKFGVQDAVRAFGKACAGHVTDACYSLGTLYLDRYRMDVDAERAGRAFSDGCADGDDRACSALRRPQDTRKPR